MVGGNLMRTLWIPFILSHYPRTLVALNGWPLINITLYGVSYYNSICTCYLYMLHIRSNICYVSFIFIMLVYSHLHSVQEALLRFCWLSSQLTGSSSEMQWSVCFCWLSPFIFTSTMVLCKLFCCWNIVIIIVLSQA